MDSDSSEDTQIERHVLTIFEDVYVLATAQNEGRDVLQKLAAARTTLRVYYQKHDEDSQAKQNNRLRNAHIKLQEATELAPDEYGPEEENLKREIKKLRARVPLPDN